MAAASSPLGWRLFSARKASSLWRRENISGWLYTSTRYAAGKRMQSEQRREIREQKLVVMQETSKEAEGDWEKFQPVIDEAMHELPESDRDAVLQAPSGASRMGKSSKDR